MHLQFFPRLVGVMKRSHRRGPVTLALALLSTSRLRPADQRWWSTHHSALSLLPHRRQQQPTNPFAREPAASHKHHPLTANIRLSPTTEPRRTVMQNPPRIWTGQREIPRGEVIWGTASGLY
ncbi:hypothetical protein P691DRAFT_801750 [Macrolepiota fuliginosa MF-IS2]|uniref:Uncharacterized protein n=1 Tax=Macrolepiota fuliginosa MF-IS2 TaxID=1400762 RepID=A0A9P6BWN6_9AGAR|nr:hypothetical protein P691DRAFT_801750 [Macrolepiota fuliginosa MF-IS2]